MTNRFLGEGDATAGGVTYRLRFDMNVLADLEDKTGKSAMLLLQQMEEGGTPISTRRAVCHAMLKRHHPEATIEVAGDILSEAMPSFTAVLETAMQQGAGKAVKPGRDGQRPPSATPH